ncbi:MAG: nicotinate (nicotinamide) nucleotide adenylyltransferase [Desulfobacterales bacterium]|nr:nicotinate (nicotinamide) nucleotide adenylyltransferase [Desulfobacterales bacterium]MBF0395355.1 nicotinate (nicotinamide) nucleotide adenylyltransferase [Desulfobacterales bacterium]
MRIGLFGGTYNPIHIGHLRAAEEVYEGFSLDKIYLIPSSLPPHKDISRVIEAKYRLEMIKLAISGIENFVVSNVEIDRGGQSYTIDTINYFKSTLPQNAELFLIIGIDAFLEINTWKAYKDFFSIIPFIVVSRPSPNDKILKPKLLENYLHSVISNRYKFFSDEASFKHNELQSIFMFNITDLDISSTKIRNLIKSKKSIRFLVNEKVNNFILEKRLYL